MTECLYCGDPSPEHDPGPCELATIALGDDIYGESIAQRAYADAVRAGTLPLYSFEGAS